MTLLKRTITLADVDGGVISSSESFVETKSLVTIDANGKKYYYSAEEMDVMRRFLNTEANNNKYNFRQGGLY